MSSKPTPLSPDLGPAMFDEAARTANQLSEQYSPCLPNLLIHNLHCGHKVKTKHLERCASNCSAQALGQYQGHSTFVCPVCRNQRVQLEIAVRIYDMGVADAQMLWDDKHKLAQQEVEFDMEVKEKGLRKCEAVGDFPTATPTLSRGNRAGAREVNATELEEQLEKREREVSRREAIVAQREKEVARREQEVDQKESGLCTLCSEILEDQLQNKLSLSETVRTETKFIEQVPKFEAKIVAVDPNDPWSKLVSVNHNPFAVEVPSETPSRQNRSSNHGPQTSRQNIYGLHTQANFNFTLPGLGSMENHNEDAMNEDTTNSRDSEMNGPRHIIPRSALKKFAKSKEFAADKPPGIIVAPNSKSFAIRDVSEIDFGLPSTGTASNTTGQHKGFTVPGRSAQSDGNTFQLQVPQQSEFTLNIGSPLSFQEPEDMGARTNATIVRAENIFGQPDQARGQLGTYMTTFGSNSQAPDMPSLTTLQSLDSPGSSVAVNGATASEMSLWKRFEDSQGGIPHGELPGVPSTVEGGAQKAGHEDGDEDTEML